MFKTASGAMEHVAICLVSNLNNAIKILKENNVWVYAMDSDSKKDIFDYNFNNRSAFVFGSEGSGISDLVKKNCDEVIKIGISKNMESLNVSNAVSSVLSIYNYRQKKTA
jgi:23S rRNA (guanosine2251-2'-O)-methyltransferase